MKETIEFELHDFEPEELIALIKAIKNDSFIYDRQNTTTWRNFSIRRNSVKDKWHNFSHYNYWVRRA